MARSISGSAGCAARARRRAGSAGTGHDLVAVDPRGAEVPADWATLRSPENYTGYGRTENFASPGGVVPGKAHSYAIPERLRLNEWALAGDWTTEDEASTLKARGRSHIDIERAFTVRRLPQSRDAS